jgi:acyl-CoA synthetase (AMP-forming)/AMP-acid ligase II
VLPFFLALEGRGNRPALVESGRVISYAGLAEAAELSVAGLPAARQLVVLGFANAAESVAAYLGCLRKGHVPILCSPKEQSELVALAEHYGASLVFNGRSWDALASATTAPLHQELGLLLRTSGSTGSPKLVRLSKENIVANARSIASYLNLDGNDRAITTLPSHYSYGLSVLNSHLEVGGSIVLTEESVTSPAFWELVDQESPTGLAGVPYTYELLEKLRFRDRSFPSLRMLTQAGGRLRPELVEAYLDWANRSGTKFYVMYGQTEATARIAYLPPDRAKGNETKIGVAIPGGELKVIDDRGEEITASGQAGELVYCGPNVMLGYAEQAVDLQKPREMTELRTGDIARFDDSGLFEIVGRKSRFCKPFGIRVNLDDLEDMLRPHVGISVVAGTDELVAVGYSSADTPRAIEQLLADRLDMPAQFFRAIQYPKIPRLPSGKADYAQVLRSALALQESSIEVRRNEGVRGLFLEVFPGRSVDDQSSFVSLGGDSLNFVNLSIGLEKVVGSLPAGWESMTVGELCDLDPELGAGSKWRARVDSDILLRSLAVVIVVFDHARASTSWNGIFGGSEMFLLLAGYSLGRFRTGFFATNRFWDVLKAFITRVMLPFYCLIVAYSLLTGKGDVDRFLLIGTFAGLNKGGLEPFWFIEALFHIYLFLQILSFVRPLRQMAGRQPFLFGAALVVVGAIIHHLSPLIFSHQGLYSRTADQLFTIVAVGWWIPSARTPGQKAIVVVSCAALLVSGSLRDGNLIPFSLAVLVLLALPWASVPIWVKRGAVIVSAASFTIYLTHVFPIWILNKAGMGAFPIVKTIVGVAAGVAIQLALSLLRERWREIRTLTRNRPAAVSIDG